jgi:alpha-galactosidase
MTYMRWTLFLISCAAMAADSGITLQMLKRTQAGVTASGPGVKLSRRWSGGICRSRLTNTGKSAVRVKEVVLFRVAHKLPPETQLYGESFQMLSQTAGTLGKPVDLGYSELKHYRLPQPADATVVSGVLTLTPPGGRPLLLGFTSCRRFNGRFYLRPGSIEVALDTEELEMQPGESWQLEDFLFAAGPSRAELLARLAGHISENHPPLRFPKPPAGWCSWYCFGPRVTAKQVLDNLDTISKDIPALKYVQLDDGYQRAMGDWLETGQAFGGGVQSVLRQIRERGFEPAIWVAPFIAEAGSHVFQQHPDWFMKDAAGKPLPANQVTFGGWRRGPWYALDGTNPEVQKHLENLFRTMRQEWGVTYFKLDANFWGAMHGGRLYDAKATRVEAYRRGMQAVLRGAGDAFILGCNHPIWASFGLIHGSRSSGDIKRAWGTIEKVSRQNLNRNWQNGRLWWNDPDAVVLVGNLPDNEFQFHATATYASGGMVLSGDDLSRMPAARMAVLKKLLPPAAQAAAFEDESLRVGWTRIEGGRMLSVFNWNDAPQTITVKLPNAVRVTDYWTGEDLGRRQGTLELKDMPAHSARLFRCE